MKELVHLALEAAHDVAIDLPRHDVHELGLADVPVRVSEGAVFRDDGVVELSEVHARLHVHQADGFANFVAIQGLARIALARRMCGRPRECCLEAATEALLQQTLRCILLFDSGAPFAETGEGWGNESPHDRNLLFVVDDHLEKLAQHGLEVSSVNVLTGDLCVLH